MAYDARNCLQMFHLLVCWPVQWKNWTTGKIIFYFHKYTINDKKYIFPKITHFVQDNKFVVCIIVESPFCSGAT